MKQHITRAYNSFSIDKNLGTITKISKETRLKNEINYYKEIAAINNKGSVFFPRMLSSIENAEGYEMELEYYGYDNLGDHMVYKPFDVSFWTSVAKCLQQACRQFAQTVTSSEDSDNFATAMYIEKTEKYYYDLINNFEKFNELSQKKNLTIDGQQCRSFATIWDEIKEAINNQLLPLNDLSIIHGDFCFSNILCGTNKKTNTTLLKFVDPRGSFGVEGIFGDPWYDAAKLLHSYEGGYEYIIYDEFEVEENPQQNTYNIHFSNNNKDKIARVFEDVTNFRSLKSKLIEGLIYIGMCSRHYDSEKRQTAMYLNGLKILNGVLEGKV